MVYFEGFSFFSHRAPMGWREKSLSGLPQSHGHQKNVTKNVEILMKTVFLRYYTRHFVVGSCVEGRGYVGWQLVKGQMSVGWGRMVKATKRKTFTRKSPFLWLVRNMLFSQSYGLCSLWDRLDPDAERQNYTPQKVIEITANSLIKITIFLKCSQKSPQNIEIYGDQLYASSKITQEYTFL